MSQFQAKHVVQLLALFSCIVINVGCNNSKDSSSPPIRFSIDGDQLTGEEESQGSDVASEESEGTQTDNVDANATSTEIDATEIDDKSFVETPAGKGPWIFAEQLPWEMSQVQYINGQPAGFTHTIVTPPALSASNRITIKRTDSMEFVRAGHKTRIKTVLETMESYDGRLQEMTETTSNGTSLVKTTGSLTRGELRLVTTLGTSVKQQVVNLDYQAWGAMGIQAILMQSVMVPGERRSAKVYLPQLRAVVDVKLIASEPELTPMLDGTRVELVPVEVTMIYSADNGIRSKNWINAKGEIEKTVALTGLNHVAYRTSRDVVQRMQDQYRLEESNAFTLTLDGDFPTEPAKEVMYLAVATGIEDLLTSGGNQLIQAVTSRRAAVTVTALAADQFPAEEPSKDFKPFLEPSKFVQSNHPTVDRLATEWTGSASKPLQIALALNKAVFDNLGTVEPFSPRFDSAAEVASRLTGNCNEHAVLLAALLRNRAIPARIASGLMVDREKPSQLTIHLWTEAWLDDHWLPLDSTTGKLTDVGYIKFLDSALTSQNPLEAITPVADALANMTIGVSTVN
ncbi:MAG: transglutaminase domain-containing protein [Planctomycetales bacterium]|nr:transglutaminase domain-containing protein [Planctomycetales bacterium]